MTTEGDGSLLDQISKTRKGDVSLDEAKSLNRSAVLEFFGECFGRDLTKAIVLGPPTLTVKIAPKEVVTFSQPKSSQAETERSKLIHEGQRRAWLGMHPKTPLIDPGYSSVLPTKILDDQTREMREKLENKIREDLKNL